MQTAGLGTIGRCNCLTVASQHRASVPAPAHACRPAQLLSNSSTTSQPHGLRRMSGVHRRSYVVHAKPRKLSAEELEVALGDRDVPTIVDFYATWCGPCVLLAKELEKVADDLGDAVRIYKVDTDENPALSTSLQIQGLPTMVFIGTDVNKPALRTEGLLPAETIKQIVANEL